MIASDVLNRIRILLNDTVAVRWSNDELLSWLTDGQRALAMVRPDASGVRQAVTLVAGTRQTLPADCSRLFEVSRNLSATGAPGRGITYVERDALESMAPNWHAATASATIRHYVYDGRDKAYFYVYPPAVANTQVELFYSKIPAAVTTTTATLEVPDMYLDALVNYVAYRAYSKDAEFGANAALASNYLSLFTALVGAKTKTDVAFSPELHNKGATPDAAAMQAGSV